MVTTLVFWWRGTASFLCESLFESTFVKFPYEIEFLTGFLTILLPWEHIVGLFKKATPRVYPEVSVTAFKCSGTGLEGNLALVSLLQGFETRVDTCVG